MSNGACSKGFDSQNCRKSTSVKSKKSTKYLLLLNYFEGKIIAVTIKNEKKKNILFHC